MNINKFNTEDYLSHNQYASSFQPIKKASRKDNEAKREGKAWSRVDKREMWEEDI